MNYSLKSTSKTLQKMDAIPTNPMESGDCKHHWLGSDIEIQERMQTSMVHTAPDGALRPSEKCALIRHEKIIAKGWETFVEVGKALGAIRDQRLYRKQYQTFERYCQERWDFRRDYAYKLICAAETVKELSGIADVPLPTNEAQVRPLIGLSNSKLKQTWLSVVNSAKGQPITARLVKEKAAAVEERDGPSNLPSNLPSMRPTKKGLWRLRENIQLNRYLDDLERSVRMGKPDEVIMGLIKEIRQWLEGVG